MKWVLSAVLMGILVLESIAQEDHEVVREDGAHAVTIYVADVEAKEFLGDGWSSRTKIFNRMVRWLTRMEGDVYIELAEAVDHRITIRACPQYLNYRRQNIGLYVNNRFVEEWVFPDSPAFAEFEAVIPSEMLVTGANVITFRAGYKRRIRPDPRELSIAVNRIELTPM